MQSQSPTPFTSTTAPGTTFSSREELAQHYKSDWHKYNLKRREANLPMLTQYDYQARLDAAMALRREKEWKDKKLGTNHLKKHSPSTQEPASYSSSSKVVGIKTSSTPAAVEVATAAGNLTNESRSMSIDKTHEQQQQEMEEEEEEQGNIDPTLSLFDRHVSTTVQENIQYMYQKYGFFVPDYEYLVDVQGFVGYCHEKIQLGHVCLYCQKIFISSQSCKQHMIQTRHTKIQYQGR